MSSYSDLGGTHHLDFRYNTRGVYHNEAPSQRPYRKALKRDRNDLRGKVCPACGLTRSMTNLCDCNSD